MLLQNGRSALLGHPAKLATAGPARAMATRILGAADILPESCGAKSISMNGHVNCDSMSRVFESSSYNCRRWVPQQERLICMQPHCSAWCIRQSEYGNSGRMMMMLSGIDGGSFTAYIAYCMIRSTVKADIVVCRPRYDAVAEPLLYS